MERYIDAFGKMAFLLLAVWVVLAGLGYTTMPGLKQQIKKQRKQRAKGSIWQQSVITAPNAEDSLAYPAAPVM